jgi:Domain of unknown function (DUF4041)/T5orf172 domain
MFNKSKVEDLTARVAELEVVNRNLSTPANLEFQQLVHEIESKKQELSKIDAEVVARRHEIKEVQKDLVTTSEILILQEVGVYEFSHVLEDAVAYKDRLNIIQTSIKAFNRADGGAVTGTTNWTVNNSEAAGKKMIKEVSKLMLRAYNGEVDDAIRTLKPYKLEAAIDRLSKVRGSIEKLGKSMSIAITDQYHSLRIQELELTADFLQQQAAEKEAQKLEKERLREEAKAQKELAAEKARLEKERDHYQHLLAKAQENGDEEVIGKAESKILELTQSIQDVEEHAANIRTGWVYVISNIGSFGEGIVKIGMTRRQEYQDRIHELSNASVPFVFDVHAAVFSSDAVSLEHSLHLDFDSRRVNRVNGRKEFFRVSIEEVKGRLAELADDHVMVFNEVAEAAEWRISEGEKFAPA